MAVEFRAGRASQPGPYAERHSPELNPAAAESLLEAVGQGV